MGATFCNLFCREGEAELLRGLIDPKDRLLTGYAGWCMALAEDQRPDRMARVAKKLLGDALVFFCFEEDCFELTLYQGGKKAALLGSGTERSRLAALAALLPDDPNALKKLKAAVDCVSLEEKVRLLEETFGLPFWALHEQERVPAVVKSDKTWLAVKARMDALKKRPNRFREEPLSPEEWPASVRRRMWLIKSLRGKLPASLLGTHILYEFSSKEIEEHGRPGHLLIPTMMGLNDNTRHYVIAADTEKEEIRAFHIPYQGGASPLMLRDGGTLVCTDHRRAFCLNGKGEEVWAFDPGLTQKWQILEPAPARRGELVFYNGHRVENAGNGIWRVSPEDGRVLRERVFPDGEGICDLQWMPEMECFLYRNISQRTVILLDEDFRETRRFAFEQEDLCSDMKFFAGQYGYAQVRQPDGVWGMARLDLVSGEVTRVRPEVSLSICGILPGGLYWAAVEDRSDTICLLDAEGRVVSRHRFKGEYMCLWAEGDSIYAAVMAGNPYAAACCVNKILNLEVSVFRLVDQGGTTA